MPLFAQIERLFRTVDVDHSGVVDVLDWLDYVEPLRVRSCACYCVCDAYRLCVCAAVRVSRQRSSLVPALDAAL